MHWIIDGINGYKVRPSCSESSTTASMPAIKWTYHRTLFFIAGIISPLWAPTHMLITSCFLAVSPVWSSNEKA